jgi:hypothetical protein
VPAELVERESFSKQCHRHALLHVGVARVPEPGDDLVIHEQRLEPIELARLFEQGVGRRSVVRWNRHGIDHRSASPDSRPTEC